MNITREQYTVLAVDDDDLNLEIMLKDLKKSGYNAVGLMSGEEAVQYLEEKPSSIDVLLLDKMMPGMSGIEVLQKLKAHPVLHQIPVILQTGDVGEAEMLEGISAGAYHYLTKPYSGKIMVGLVDATIRDAVSQSDVFQNIKHEDSLTSLMNKAEFVVHDFLEARQLSGALASRAADPKRVSIGLYELMSNAIEHGNLEFGFEVKKELLSSNQYQQVLDQRLNDPAFAGRKVVVSVEFNHNYGLKVIIADDGEGFRWKNYMDFDPLRLSDPNGRGIAKASVLGLRNLTYNEKGNVVEFYIDK